MTNFNEQVHVPYPIQVARDQGDHILYFVMWQINLDSKKNNNDKKGEIMNNLRAA